MRLAFYAPMKSPHHSVPSGDRSIARGLMQAFRHLGAEVELVSEFRSRDGAGDAEVQARLIREAGAERERLLTTPDRWDAWVTYHNYYKAPDLLGPDVSRKLGIPYLLVEATRARKRLTGPWAAFAKQAEAATDAAKVVYYFSQRDGEALHRDAPEGQDLLHLRPFLIRDDLPAASAGGMRLLSVGMLREGDKLASYQIIAKTLTRLPDLDWQLDIVGDGPARAEVEAMMTPFGDRVTFHGALTGAALEACYRAAGLFFWPGVNEALGMAFLEAQAAGLPVIAQNRPGMREVLAPGDYPTVEQGPEGLAAMMRNLMSDDAARQAAQVAARRHVKTQHLLPQAAETLKQGLLRAGVAA